MFGELLYYMVISHDHVTLLYYIIVNPGKTKRKGRVIVDTTETTSTTQNPRRRNCDISPGAARRSYLPRPVTGGRKAPDDNRRHLTPLRALRGLPMEGEVGWATRAVGVQDPNGKVYEQRQKQIQPEFAG